MSSSNHGGYAGESVATVSVPPSGMASGGLSSRFKTALWRSDASPFTVASPGSGLQVKANLVLIAHAQSPLFLILEPEPFSPAAVDVVTENKEEGLLTQFLSLFDSIEDKVLDGVRATVAEIVTKTLAGAGESLRIDVEAKVQAALGA